MNKQSSLMPLALLLLLLSACVEAPPPLTQEQYYGPSSNDDALSSSDNGSSQSDGSGTDGIDGTDGETGVDGTDSTDGTSGTDGTDGADGTDPPECIPATVPGDWCDGLDNDCDGEIDEDGGPPSVSETFKTPHGWLLVSPKGFQNHLTGPISFEGVQDLNTAAMLKMSEWSGDIRMRTNLVLTHLSPGAEFFIGTWVGAQISVDEPVTGKTGVVLTGTDAGDSLVKVIFNDEIVHEVIVSALFQQIEFEIMSAKEKIRVRLLQGDGQLAKEIVLENLSTVPKYSGLALYVTNGPVIALVSKVVVGPGLSCKTTYTSTCATPDDCDPPEPCQVTFCNPFWACEYQEHKCPFATGCKDAGVCDPEKNVCVQNPINNGQPCEIDKCTTGSLCNADGVCDGGEPVTSCPAPEQCQTEGQCNPLLGGCVYGNQPGGTACDDQSLCTGPDVCDGGICGGPASVTCPVAGVCQNESICDPGTGECSEVTNQAPGAECDDGDPCTVGDVCDDQQGCAGEPMNCDDKNGCTADKCDAGVCVNEPSLDCSLWTTTLDAPIRGPAALGPDNALYVTGASLHRVTIAGAVDWSTTFGKITSLSPVISDDGASIYVGDVIDDGTARLTSVNAVDGNAAWSFAIPGNCLKQASNDPCRVNVPPTQNGGTLLVPTVAGLYAVSQSGEKQWESAEVSSDRSSAVVANSGHLYVGTSVPTPGLVSLKSDGSVRWHHFTGGTLLQTPVVNEPDIYLVTGGNVVAVKDVEDKPEQQWTLALEAGSQTQPVLDEQGRLIVATGTQVIAIDTTACDGTAEKCIVWKHDVADDLGSIGRSLTATNGGRVAFGTNEGNLNLIFSADGAANFALALDPMGISTGINAPLALTVADSGLLVVTSEEGKIRALNFSQGVAPAQSPWPVFNLRQSRNARSK